MTVSELLEFTTSGVVCRDPKVVRVHPRLVAETQEGPDWEVTIRETRYVRVEFGWSEARGGAKRVPETHYLTADEAARFAENLLRAANFLRDAA